MILSGWLGREHEEKAYEKNISKFIPCTFRDTDKTHEYLWDYMKTMNDGKNLQTFRQETGDCVSAASKHAVEYIQAVQKVEDRDNLEFRRVFSPYIYGVSRTDPECGNGQLGRSAGSVGAWAVVGMQKKGILFVDDKNVPAYSGSLADQWGYRGVPKEFYDEASDNPVKGVSKVTSISQLRSALLNRCPVIIGSQWGFRAVKEDNHIVYKRNGWWGHEMVFIGWHDDPWPGAFRLNSWYPMIDDTAASKDMKQPNGEPDGGAWCHAEDLEREIKDSELFALYSFDAHKANKGRFFI